MLKTNMRNVLTAAMLIALLVLEGLLLAGGVTRSSENMMLAAFGVLVVVAVMKLERSMSDSASPPAAAAAIAEIGDASSPQPWPSEPVSVGELAIWPSSPVSDDDKLAAIGLAVKCTHGLATADIRKAIAGLLIENMRLSLEINEHRRARGYKPLAVTEQ